MLEINQPALAYWKSHGYKKEDIDQVCKELDDEFMLARVSFEGNGKVNVSISKKTWSRQEGHYPTVLEFFAELAKLPQCEELKGTILVWLEDGLWLHNRDAFKKVPVFTYGKHFSDHESLLMPDPSFLKTFGYKIDRDKINSWDNAVNKKLKTIFWRGAASGIGIEGPDWSSTPRGRITLLSNKISNLDILDAKITRYKHLSDEQKEVLKQAEVIGEECEFKDFLNYLYLIDADGYSCAWQSLFLKLLSKSLVLKIHSNYRQWYFDKLIPWVHYVPIREDLCDLLDTYDWLIHNDSEVRAIIANANSLLEEITYEKELDNMAELIQIVITQMRE